MLSERLLAALEREVVGQPRAVQTVTRSITVALAGLGPTVGPLGIFLFVGPSGTGKTHLARTLARHLHGDESRLAVIDCTQLGSRHEWTNLSRLVAPHFREGTAEPGGSLRQQPWLAPLSILLVEHIEKTRPEIIQALVSAVETGTLILPDGRCGSLRGCLIVLTSSLCAREIFEAGRQEIGFVRGADIEESEKARIYQLCVQAAEKTWGADLLAHLDDLIVFHRLGPTHLPAILERLVVELNSRLASRATSCSLAAPAAAVILGRAERFLRHGAWGLAKLFRRFVVFPIADLVRAGHVPAGSTLRVELEGSERLRFSVTPPAGDVSGAPVSEMGRPMAIPIAWLESGQLKN